MRSTHQRFFLVIVCLAIGLVLLIQSIEPHAGAIQTAAKSTPSRLPIFKLAAPRSDAANLKSNAQGILGLRGEAKQVGSRLSIRDGSKVYDVNTKSGAIWAADQSQIWNPKLKPSLPDKEKARSIADSFLRSNNLLTQSKSQYSTLSFASIGGTHAAYYDPASKKRSERQLDIQVIYNTKINIPGLDQPLPVVGGGGEINVTIGDQGRVVGLQALERAIEGVETESPVVPQERADAQFKELTKGLKLNSFKSWLAYYAAPPTVAQSSLYPVYVYSATTYIGKELVPLRLIMIPATEFGPKLKANPPVKRRPANTKPTRRSTMPEGPDERGTQTKENAHAALQGSGFEAASSFIGTSGGLSGSANNVQGFVNKMSGAGWNINFVWGDGNAFETDWNSDDDNWLDAADFVFYTGHANMNGWSLSNPNDGSLDFTEVGGGPENLGDIWGRQDLEWVIVAACGPLQDEVISSGGGDVFDRWDGAFDGLHQLLGYGAITFDNEEEGDSVADYALDGDTVINAWFRTAREIQPGDNGASAPDGPTVWVGVMYVGKSGADPGNDHIWGHGSVSSDPRSPTFYVAMWTTC